MTRRIKTCAHDKRTRPAEEGELARCVLEIAVALKLLLLQLSRSPAVEGRDGHGCEHGECGGHGITFGATGIGERFPRAQT